MFEGINMPRAHLRLMLACAARWGLKNVPWRGLKPYNYAQKHELYDDDDDDDEDEDEDDDDDDDDGKFNPWA